MTFKGVHGLIIQLLGVHGLEERESASGRPQRGVFRAGVVQRIFPLLHAGSGNKVRGNKESII